MVKDNPHVSVIVPNYNYGRYLRKRLRTVLDQTYGDFELIYLDDGSTDDSNTIIAEFDKDPRVRCFFNERNSGSPFIQINKGVRLARGDLIWVAEADDYAHPRLLESLVSVLDQNASVGVAYCQSVEVDEKGKESRLVSYLNTGNPERWTRDFIASGAEECRRYLFFRNTIPNFSAVVFRRNIFQDAGYADESLKLCGDWLIWLQMLMISDIAYMVKPMNYYRQHALAVRKGLRLPLQIKEAYYVYEYCRRKIGVTEADAQKISRHLMRMWIRNCMWKGKVRAKEDLIMLIRIARRNDPRFWPNLFRYVPEVFVSGLSKEARRYFRV